MSELTNILGMLLSGSFMVLLMGPFLVLMYAKEALCVGSFVAVLFGGALAVGGSRKWAFRLVAGGGAVFALSIGLILYTAYFYRPSSVFYNDYYSPPLPQWPLVDNAATVFAGAAVLALAGGLIMLAVGAVRWALAQGRKRRPVRLLAAGGLSLLLAIDLAVAAGITSLFAIALDVVLGYAVFAFYNGPLLKVKMGGVLFGSRDDVVIFGADRVYGRGLPDRLVVVKSRIGNYLNRPILIRAAVGTEE